MEMPYASIRTYYTRVYEAKFITGAIAGAMAGGDRIGYVADYPSFGVPANINAFALGARMTNPNVRIDLQWTCLPDQLDPLHVFTQKGITVISGRDVMAVMPTGGGKSVCYQLPAARPGTFTLVVTPLRALMRDQVRHLRSRGIPAALIDSGLDEKERAEVYGRALSGELRILYVAPERLHAPDFADFSHRIRISLFAVDEAHCVLHWGSDFRPSYMRIGEFIDSLSPRPVTMALTATASRTQAGEIRELLHLADP